MWTWKGQANYDGSHAYNSGATGEYRQKTVLVEEFQPNAFGLYQMHGNVWEWCEDRWHGSYEAAPEDGSAWVDGTNNVRVVRGSSWYSFPSGLRSAFLSNWNASTRDNRLGFRLVQD